jgi:thiol:disulfide interchange protein DsbD
MGAIMGAIGGGIGIQAYFQSPWLLLPFAFIFILLALALFGFFNVQMPAAIQSRLNEMSNRQQSGNLIGVAIMGVLSGLIIGPCGGPFLIAALGYAAGSGDWFLGFLYLFLFGNGIGLPLLVVGASGGALLPKAGNWMNVVKAVGGVMLLGVVIVLLERMPHLFSPTLTMMLWAILFIVASIYMGAMQTLDTTASGWRKLWKGIGTVVFIYGLIVMLGGLTGASDVTRPLHGSQLTAKVVGSSAGEATQQLHFKRIKSADDLQQELAQAKAQGKPVILDFYADWCTYCIEYERYVFPEANVQAQLKNYVLLQADVTAMDDADKTLMKNTRVLLPPAILFFDTQSEEIRPQRIVGAMKADAFEQHLRNILKDI